ncbi:MAG: hypothetical protein FWG68_08260 [Defluviitaleaceae bacterium]|nr:hypothetical protein [Defluviitaleaceae bacterium]
MQLKSVLFGLGLGMVLLSAIFLFAYNFEHGQNNQTDSQIIEQASQLGMVWPEEDAVEIVRKALEMGMVFDTIDNDDVDDIDE